MTTKPTWFTKQMVFTWCLLSACILLLVPHSVTAKLQFAFTRLMSRPLHISRVLSLRARLPMETTISPYDYQSLLAKNRELQNHVDHLQALLQEKDQKIAHLSKLPVTPDVQRLGFVPADVITDIQSDQLIINRGRNDRVTEGQFVLSENAIIGTVSAVSTYRARVALLSDKHSRIQVYVRSDTQGGFLIGKGNGVIKITDIPRKHTIDIGDVVYACRQPGLLETAFPVGSVADVKPDAEEPLFWDISIKRASQPDQANRVDVIVPLEGAPLP